MRDDLLAVDNPAVPPPPRGWYPEAYPFSYMYMNGLRLRALIIAAGCLALQFVAAHLAAAAISNGEPAMDEIGQYDANNSSTLTPIYSMGAANSRHWP